MSVIYTQDLNKDSGGGRQLFPELAVDLSKSMLDTVELAISVAFTGMSYGTDQKQYITLDIVSDQPDISGKKIIYTLSCPAINNQPHVFQCIGIFKKSQGAVKISSIFNTTDCTITGSKDAGGYLTISYI